MILDNCIGRNTCLYSYFSSCGKRGRVSGIVSGIAKRGKGKRWERDEWEKASRNTHIVLFGVCDMPNIFYPNSISQRHGEHPPDGVRSPQSAANAPLNGPYVCVDSARNLEATSAFFYKRFLGAEKDENATECWDEA